MPSRPAGSAYWSRPRWRTVPEPSEPGAVDPTAVEERPEPVIVPAKVVESQGQYLKRWTFLLVLLTVWIPAFAIGLGLFYWWYHDHSLGKTAPVFVILLYVVLCTVAGLLIAMAQSKPLIAALAIAVMSAPYASVGAAAPLYGAYYCDQLNLRCVAGVLPY